MENKCDTTMWLGWGKPDIKNSIEWYIGHHSLKNPLTKIDVTNYKYKGYTQSWSTYLQ